MREFFTSRDQDTHSNREFQRLPYKHSTSEETERQTHKILHCRENVRTPKIKKINQKMKSIPQNLEPYGYILLLLLHTIHLLLLPALTYHLCNRMRPYRTVENQTQAETCGCYCCYAQLCCCCV